MQNKILYYKTDNNNPVKDFINNLDIKTNAKILKILHYMKNYGLESVSAYIKKLSGSPLWEIRILGKTNVRIIFALYEKGTIWVLHGFIKKTNKTPRIELKTAMERYTKCKNLIDR
ncbi:type II toxin-antitoxin system RelE/ParE family toxin [Patescibacteria group bacterium]|jgi:phage-related protein|nr:type II toxin-antitoxin system RelE/ParE family toxin [Patescibacteria group bacterium]